MKRKWQALPYLAVAGVLMILVVASPASWATATADDSQVTVPTRTPTPEPVTPTDVPPVEPPPATVAPEPTAQPGATATAVAGSGSGAARTATPNAACLGPTALTLVSDQLAVAPGATVVFTATLTNTGRQPLQQLVLEDQLSDGLEPGKVLSGPGAWQGRTLRVTDPVFGAGERVVVVYTASVAAQPGPVIQVRASATTAGCPARTATVALALPPSELPRTGGN